MGKPDTHDRDAQALADFLSDADALTIPRELSTIVRVARVIRDQEAQFAAAKETIEVLNVAARAISQDFSRIIGEAEAAEAKLRAVGELRDELRTNAPPADLIASVTVSTRVKIADEIDRALTGAATTTATP